MHEARDYGFEEEYRVNTYIDYFIVFYIVLSIIQNISTEPQSSCDIAKLPANRIKNRYANIYACK